LHWAVADVFDQARQKGWHSPGWEPFSAKILEVGGLHIPSGTLKYWERGYSEPKVTELEAMAEAVGYELELLLPAIPAAT